MRAQRLQPAMRRTDEEGALRRILAGGDEDFTGQQLNAALCAAVSDIDGAAGVERELRAVIEGHDAALVDARAVIGRPAAPWAAAFERIQRARRRMPAAGPGS